MVEDESFVFIRKELEKGTVRRRRCDVCGCELDMPDVGIFGRDCLNTTACTICSNTKSHYDLLTYIEDLRKTKSKKDILKILDERMIETWGEASIFTIDEFDELIESKGEKNNGKFTLEPGHYAE